MVSEEDTHVCAHTTHTSTSTHHTNRCVFLLLFPKMGCGLMQLPCSGIIICTYMYMYILRCRSARMLYPIVYVALCIRNAVRPFLPPSPSPPSSLPLTPFSHTLPSCPPPSSPPPLPPADNVQLLDETIQHNLMLGMRQKPVSFLHHQKLDPGKVSIH